MRERISYGPIWSPEESDMFAVQSSVTDQVGHAKIGKGPDEMKLLKRVYDHVRGLRRLDIGE
jgi:hypothetical protein